MLDINLIRKSPDLVKKNLEKKFQKDMLPWVDDLIEKDKEFVKTKFEAEQLKKRKNELSAEINKLKKEKKDAAKLLDEAKKIPQQLIELEAQQKELQEKINYHLMRLPNILHDSVPIGKDDTENVEIKKWGAPRAFDFEPKGHGELLEELGVGDFKRSAKVAGAGFYYLRGPFALLNQALIRFALDFLIKKGYTYVEPPLMMHRKTYEGVVDLKDFESVMYKVENEDLFLIATSEHPLVGQFQDESLSEEDLPVKMAGYSMCFRKEIGAHGVDTKGLFRTHQFNKVEQIILCKPEDSYKYYDELLENSEALFRALELPYRILEICSGDCSSIKAKSADLEVWMPKQKAYKELGSLTNCTDYQARRLGIKCIDKEGNRRVLHTLNNTAIATSRALVAIAENYQNKDGSITIPSVLVPYMNGIKKIEKIRSF
ncbi:MAG: serine--tRNA ligase [Nanoarchaeota archaeon]